MGATLKRWMSGSVLTGMVVATMGLGIWVFSTPSHAKSWERRQRREPCLYIIGQVLILLGAAVELFMMRSPETQELSPIRAPSMPALAGEGNGSGVPQPTAAD